MRDLTPVDMVRLTVGGLTAMVAPSDATGLVSFLTLLSQHLHAEERTIKHTIDRVRCSGEISSADWLALAEAVRAALLFQSHTNLMIVTTIEQAMSPAVVKE